MSHSFLLEHYFDIQLLLSTHVNMYVFSPFLVFILKFCALLSLQFRSSFCYRSRLLPANLLQPLKDIETINARLDCLVSIIRALWFSYLHLWCTGIAWFDCCDISNIIALELATEEVGFHISFSKGYKSYVSALPTISFESVK